MKGRLENKIALITGGNSGIGRATARRFVEEGASVVITGRNEKTIAETIAELGEDNAVGLQANVNNREEMEDVLDAVKSKFERLDILFLNAGISYQTPLGKTSEDQFDRLFDTNVKAVFFTIQSAVPHFGEQGGSIIINSSAVRSVARMPGLSAYSASKSASRSLARNLSAELAPKLIRVNSVSPGPIETPILYKEELTPEQVKGFKEFIISLTPARRFADPVEVADCVVYLASDESRFVLGADFGVDGGFGQI